MKNLKNIFLLGTLALASLAILYLAWSKGADSRIFEFTPFEKVIPLPLLFESMEGEAVKLDGNRIRADWKKKALPRKAAQNYILCRGYFRPVEETYYLLELEGQLYIEKAEFVEPLIFAMYSLHSGPSGHPAPGLIRDVILLLPDDHEKLVALASQIKKQKRD